MSANLTPATGYVFGKPDFNPEFGNAKTIESNVFLVKNLRDSTGPIASPAGYLVHKSFVFPLPDNEYAVPTGYALATWNGSGYSISDFSPTGGFALARLVGVHTGAETDGFSMLYMFEIITPDAIFNAYGPAGSIVVVDRDRVFFFDENYAFLAGMLVHPFNPRRPIATSNGGW